MDKTRYVDIVVPEDCNVPLPACSTAAKLAMHPDEWTPAEGELITCYWCGGSGCDTCKDGKLRLVPCYRIPVMPEVLAAVIRMLVDGGHSFLIRHQSQVLVFRMYNLN